MHVLKTGALYFALVFAAGWLLGLIRELWVIPHLGRTAGFLLEAPLMLMVMIVTARWTIQHSAGLDTLTARAAVGLIALTLLLLAEIAGARWVRGLSVADDLASFDPISGSLSLLMSLLFAAMPMLVKQQ